MPPNRSHFSYPFCQTLAGNRLRGCACRWKDFHTFEREENSGKCFRTHEILDALHADGWVLIEGFFNYEELREVIDVASGYYPSEREYYSNPDGDSWIKGDPFAGAISFPFPDMCLNNLPTHPRIVSLAEQCLGTTEIRLLRAGLQAKFAGAADYEQPLHYDYPNHTLVVPGRGQEDMAIGLFLYLADVTADLGPTWPRAEIEGPADRPGSHTLFSRPGGNSHPGWISLTRPNCTRSKYRRQGRWGHCWFTIRIPFIEARQ